jgi:anti-anti-sigma factor
MQLLSEVRVDWPVPDVAIVELLGEHDMANSRELEAALEHALDGKAAVVIDLSATEFIDSHVIRALYRAHTTLDAHGGLLVLQIPDESPVRRPLEIAQLDTAAALAADRDTAILTALRGAMNASAARARRLRQEAEGAAGSASPEGHDGPDEPSRPSRQDRAA